MVRNKTRVKIPVCDVTLHAKTTLYMLAWPLSCLVHVFLPVDIERKLLICSKNKKQTSKLSIRIKNLQKLNSETKKKKKAFTESLNPQPLNSPRWSPM